MNLSAALRSLRSSPLLVTVFDAVDVDSPFPAYHWRFPSITSFSGSVEGFRSVFVVDLLFPTSVTRPGETQDSARGTTLNASTENRKSFIVAFVW